MGNFLMGYSLFELVSLRNVSNTKDNMNRRRNGHLR
jgi:hypothetical protein